MHTPLTYLNNPLSHTPYLPNVPNLTQNIYIWSHLFVDRRFVGVYTLCESAFCTHTVYVVYKTAFCGRIKRFWGLTFGRRRRSPFCRRWTLCGDRLKTSPLYRRFRWAWIGVFIERTHKYNWKVTLQTAYFPLLPHVGFVVKVEFMTSTGARGGEKINRPASIL